MRTKRAIVALHLTTWMRQSCCHATRILLPRPFRQCKDIRWETVLAKRNTFWMCSGYRMWTFLNLALRRPSTPRMLRSISTSTLQPYAAECGETIFGTFLLDPLTSLSRGPISSSSRAVSAPASGQHLRQVPIPPIFATLESHPRQP